MIKPQKKQIQNQDYHILVVWPNAQKHITEIKSVLKNFFLKFDEFPVEIEKKLYINKICKIYDISPDIAQERISVSGYGPFTVFILYEENPKYENIWRFGTGYTTTNVKISNCKVKLRKFLEHPFLLHSSNDQMEAKSNLRILLGRNIDGEIVNTNEKLNSNEEVFSFLNDVDDYLILRDYSKGDIDVLTRKTPKQFSKLLDAKHERFRFLTFGPKSLVSPIDVVNVHHNIFCPIWCENMLKNKVFDTEKKVFRPNKEDLLFSLMYHYTLHKRNFPLEAQLLIIDIIKELGYTQLLGIDFSNKKDSVYYLTKFLKKNNYSVPEPLDRKMYFDRDIVNYIRNKLDKVDLLYDPEIEKNILKEIKNVNLIDLASNMATQYLKSNKKCIAFSRFNNILTSHSFLDYGFFQVAVKIDDVNLDFVLKVFHSNYKEILDTLSESLLKSVKVKSEFLNVPLKVEIKGDLIFCIEPFVLGKRIDLFVYKNKESLSSEDIDNWLNNILSSLKNLGLTHSDIHEKNIIISADNNANLIDFKFLRLIKEKQLNPITCFKSTSNDDEKAILSLSSYLKGILKGKERRDLFNPKINDFIKDQFNLEFKNLNYDINSGKRKIDNFENFLLAKLNSSKKPFSQIKSITDCNKEEAYLLNFSQKFSKELEGIRNLDNLK